MSSLVKIENKVVFSDSERLFIDSNKSVRILDKKPIELESELSEMLYSVYYYMGQQITDLELGILVENVMHDLVTEFKHQTYEEIKLAFHYGVRGRFGQFFGLNPATFNGWIRAFLVDHGRLESLKKENRFILKQKNEPTQEELEIRSKNFALKAFEEFKINGSYDDFGNPVYEYLDKKGLIPFSNKRKQEIYEQAKVSLKEKHAPAFASNQREKEIFKSVISKIESAGKDPIEIVRVESRKIALNLFFSELVEMQEELENLL